MGNVQLLNQIDINVIKELVEILDPVRATVEVLSSNETTLFTADIALEHLLQKLATFKSNIGIKIFTSIRSRINERRIEQFSSLSFFINQPNNYPPKKGFLNYSSKSALYELALNLLKRLYQKDDKDDMAELSEPVIVEPVVQETNEQKNDYRKELKLVLMTASTPRQPTTKTNIDIKSIKKEFQNYENSGQKTTNITRLINLCKAMRPTSTEPERTFSTSGNFVTKLRSRLSDIAINALVFLKFHFTRKN